MQTFRVVNASGEVFAPSSEPEKRAEGMSQEAASAIAQWFSGGAYGPLVVVPEGPAEVVPPVDSSSMTIEEFVEGLNEKFAAHRAEHFPSLPPDTVHYSPGQKYHRVFIEHSNNGGRYVHCFVEKSTGHVFKADGWKGPAKGVRFTTMEDALEAADPHGSYLYK